MSDRVALVELYKATSMRRWYNNTNWCSDERYGLWYGIVPDVAGHASKLMLGDNNLEGYILNTPVLKYFVNIKLLDLSKNCLSGIIPESIGLMVTLEDLNLSWNTFDGPIPESLYDLNELKVLQLQHNQLSGTVSLSIYNLKKMTNINISRNLLTGALPDLKGNLPMLLASDVTGNNFDG